MAELVRRTEAPETSAIRAIEGLVVKVEEPLADHSTFKIGGPGEWFVEVENEAALAALLAHVEQTGADFLILGLGSNVLFPDSGLRGVIARLTGDFKRLEIDGTRVAAGAALALAQVSRRTADAGLTGLEALSGFPSTVGGAVYMNAGCYGTEIRDVLAWASLVDPDGTCRRVTADELEPSYRRTNLVGSRTIVTGAVFELELGDAAAANRRIEELNRKRWQSLPAGVANAGSIFRNPPDDYAGRLIDECGLKGRRCGDAQISERHGNVIVNHGGARSAHVLSLMIEARAAVAGRFGVTLEPEVVLTGELAAQWARRA